MIFYICLKRVLSNALNISRDIRTSLAGQVKDMKSTYNGLTPHLTIVQVGTREDSNVYVRMKLRAAEFIGLKATHILLPSTTDQTEVLLAVKFLFKLITN